jgi:hypothetical protein
MRNTTGHTYNRKRAALTCVVHCCTNPAYWKARSPYCPKHRRQRQKETDPIGYHLDILRQNAKRRGITCTISKRAFALFCSETNYLKLKGRFKDNASIDRIEPELGYAAGNLQVLTVGDNTRKKYTDLKAAAWKPVVGEGF